MVKEKTELEKKYIHYATHPNKVYDDNESHLHILDQTSDSIIDKKKADKQIKRISILSSEADIEEDLFTGFLKTKRTK